MRYLSIILFLAIMGLSGLLNGCASPSVVVTDHGKIVKVSTQDSVLVVLKAHPTYEKEITWGNGDWTIYMVKKEIKTDFKIVESRSWVELNILINQLQLKGYELKGSVSTAKNALGKTTYTATLLK